MGMAMISGASGGLGKAISGILAEQGWNLVLVTRTGPDYQIKQITGVLFVPMTGAALKE